MKFMSLYDFYSSLEVGFVFLLRELDNFCFFMVLIRFSMNNYLRFMSCILIIYQQLEINEGYDDF